MLRKLISGSRQISVNKANLISNCNEYCLALLIKDTDNLWFVSLHCDSPMEFMEYAKLSVDLKLYPKIFRMND